MQTPSEQTDQRRILFNHYQRATGIAQDRYFKLLHERGRQDETVYLADLLEKQAHDPLVLDGLIGAFQFIGAHPRTWGHCRDIAEELTARRGAAEEIG